MNRFPALKPSTFFVADCQIRINIKCQRLTVKHYRIEEIEGTSRRARKLFICKPAEQKLSPHCDLYIVAEHKRSAKAHAKYGVFFRLVWSLLLLFGSLLLASPTSQSSRSCHSFLHLLERCFVLLSRVKEIESWEKGTWDDIFLLLDDQLSSFNADSSSVDSCVLACLFQNLPLLHLMHPYTKPTAGTFEHCEPEMVTLKDDHDDNLPSESWYLYT